MTYPSSLLFPSSETFPSEYQMPDFSTLQDRQQALIRKPLNGSIFIGASALTIPTAFSSGATAEPQALPAGYEDVGYITKDDGVSWARETESADTTSWGALEPTRRDFTSDVSTATFNMQETKKRVLELYYNVDLSGVTPTPVTGEVAFNQTTSMVTRYQRLIAISADGAGPDAVYIARVMPRVSVTSVGEQQWTDGAELTYNVTVTAYVDQDLGYSVRHVFFGPGWKSQLENMGFPAAAAS